MIVSFPGLLGVMVHGDDGVFVCVCAGLSEAKEEVEGPLPTPHHLGHNH